MLLKQRQINWFQMQLPEADTLEIIEHVELPRFEPGRNRMPPGNRPLYYSRKPAQPFQRLMGPNQIFDLVLDGKPLLLVGWQRTTG